jgi:hypothetical protein
VERATKKPCCPDQPTPEKTVEERILARIEKQSDIEWKPIPRTIEEILAQRAARPIPAKTLAVPLPHLPADWQWISLKRLAADSADLVAKLPCDISGVVGIPRSGMFPASILATLLHVPLGELRAEGVHWLQAGSRSGSLPQPEKILLIDDSVYSGGAMARAQAILPNTYTAAVYVRSPDTKLTASQRVLGRVHLFEWNFFNNGPLAGFAGFPELSGGGVGFDLDGILCHDPTCCGDAEEEPGLTRYFNWLKSAKPRWLVRAQTIPLLLTARLEKYRAETLEWLNRHRVKVRELVMHPAKSHGPARGCSRLESGPRQKESHQGLLRK